MKYYYKRQKISEIGYLKGKIDDFELENNAHEHSSMTMTCIPKRDFRIGDICANPISIAKVMVKILICA